MKEPFDGGWGYRSGSSAVHGCNFRIHVNLFIDPADGGSLYLQNVGTFNHYLMQKPPQKNPPSLQLLCDTLR